MSEISPLESSIAERYHEETKYTVDGLRRQAGPRGMPDPARHPTPFKVFDRPGVALPTAELPFTRSGDAIEATSEELASIGRILWHTNGCTRVVRYPGGLQPFRAAPSAGAMYPTEVYVALRDVPGAADGIYNYQILDHSLAPVRDEDAFPALRGALFDHPAVEAARAAVILTAEWFRSSWRYRERGYRRCLLDTGHVLGNLVAAAAAEGRAAVPFACFVDEEVERLIGVDPVDEGALVVVPLRPEADPAVALPPAPRISPVTEWRAAVDAVGERVPAEAPERLFAALHLASRLAADAPAADRDAWPAPSPAEEGVEIPVRVAPTDFGAPGGVLETIARRRSTRRFRAGPAERDAVFRALMHAWPANSPGLFAPELLRTWFVALDVRGLPPGSYALRDSPCRLIESSRGDYANQLLHLGLGQEIFVDAAGALIHTVDLPRAIRLLGDRAYRLVTLDAGHIGERLNLALLREGLGVSGCGGYLDDEMNRVLGIPENQAVVYITVLGVPAEPA